jgi:hypothetical protein
MVINMYRIDDGESHWFRAPTEDTAVKLWARSLLDSGYAPGDIKECNPVVCRVPADEVIVYTTQLGTKVGLQVADWLEILHGAPMGLFASTVF